LKRDILDELPFENKTMLTIVLGKAILAALENGFSSSACRGGFRKFPGSPLSPIRRRRQARG